MEELPLNTGTSLLTSSEVEAWREEKAKLEQEIAVKQQRLVDLEQLLVAASLLMRARGITPAEGNETQTPGGETLPDMIINILQERVGPISNNEIKALMNKSGLGRARLKGNPNYYYTAMSRLIKRGLVTKDGDRYEIKN